MPAKLGIYKFFITSSVEWQPKSSKGKKKKESAGRIFRKNLQQNLATESESDSDDGDNQSDLVPQLHLKNVQIRVTAN